MTGCDHKFVDSTRCLKCGVHIDELRGGAALGPELTDLVAGDLTELRQCYAELSAECREMFVLLERCWRERNALPAELAADLHAWHEEDFSDEPTVIERIADAEKQTKR